MTLHAGRDVRYASRLIRHNPFISGVAIATIAVTIGASSAMFAFVNGVLLKPLPYPEADRIVRVLERLPGGATNSISTLNYLDWVEQNTVFEYMAAEAAWRPTLTDGEVPVLIEGATVSARYFDIFGATPSLGRGFRPDEDQPGKDHVVLLSHRLWEERFGADASILGRQLALDGTAYTVIGILEEGGPFDRAAAQVWKPLAFDPSTRTRDFRWLGASARLRPGVTVERARSEMDLIAQRIAATYPESNKGWGIAVDRLADVLYGPQLRSAVLVLFAATGCVLLIGCANLTNLALARGSSRRNEMAVRAALGASRWRLIQQLLFENVLLAACGGVLGIGVGSVGMRWITWLLPPYSLPPAVDVRFDGAVLLFTCAVVLLTGLLCSGGPALQAAQLSLIDALNRGRRGTSARLIRRGPRNTLVVSQIALAFVLLVLSGLLLRSSMTLLTIDPGFDRTNVLTAGLPIAQKDQEAAVITSYLSAVQSEVLAVPGVRSSGIASVLPLQGWGFGVPYSIAGRSAADPSERRRAFFKVVSPSYFDLLRIRFVRGHGFTEADAAGAVHAAVINETFASREFSGEDPIGRHIVVRELIPGRTDLGEQISWEIVGVIAGEKVSGLGAPISAGIYVSYLQNPTYAVNLLVRTDVPPLRLQRAVQSAVQRVNHGQALTRVRTLEQIVDDSIVGNKVVSSILGAFASLALTLAAIGTYGVISYTAVQRTHEMGVRAALGATTGSLRRLIILAGMRLAALGVVSGFVASFVATDVVSSMLYGVDRNDPVTIGAVVAVISLVAALACLLPAWRMTTADPMEALRSE